MCIRDSLETGQLLGRQVRGDHDLLVRVVQGVERVEELLLRLHLALQLSLIHISEPTRPY
mgnify:CR=1 FL=1